MRVDDVPGRLLARVREAGRVAARSCRHKFRDALQTRALVLHEILAANNYAATLRDLNRFEEARSLLRRTMPVERRVHGTSHELTLTMRKIFAEALYEDESATLDDLREAATTLEETERIARRVLGGAHPLTVGIEDDLRISRAALRALEETPSRRA